MPANVHFHKDFIDGSWRCKKFSDFGRLTTNEAMLLGDFTLSVIDGELLPGKNKPSWLADSGEDLRNRAGYKSSQIWHYHIGPYSQNNNPSEKVRNANYEGSTSAAIVHYKWIDPSDKQNLLVLGFSPGHIPFPLPREKPNHLDSRGGFNPASKRVKSKDVFGF